MAAYYFLTDDDENMLDSVGELFVDERPDLNALFSLEMLARIAVVHLFLSVLLPEQVDKGQILADAIEMATNPPDDNENLEDMPEWLG